ncbi:MAG: hypothetical protein HWE16_02525 [Gammaproteobacteria bacterium]|nr:hypothetical protein [Gammaproteobacteria bacterium]
MDVLIPFAKNKITGKIVSVEEVDSGLNCGCECLFCKVDMVARKGSDKRIDHFAHRPKHTDENHHCPASFERSVFWMCRLILEESSTFQTPSYRLVRNNYDHRIFIDKPITSSKTIEYQSVEFPFTMSEFPSNDIAILNVSGHRVAITLNFNFDARSQIGRSSPFEFKGESLAHIQIDLKNLSAKFLEGRTGFRNILESMLCSGTELKHWVYHTREDPIIVEYTNDVNAAKAEFDAQRNKFEAKRQKIQRKKELIQRITTSKAASEPVRRTKEQINDRLRALIRSAEDLRDLGIVNAVRCEMCKFTSPSDSISCGYCSESDFESVVLDEDFFYCIENKYYNWNFAESSLDIVYTTTN